MFTSAKLYICVLFWNIEMQYRLKNKAVASLFSATCPYISDDAHCAFNTDLPKQRYSNDDPLFWPHF